MSTVLKKTKKSGARKNNFKKFIFALTEISGFCFAVSALAYHFYKSALLYTMLITFGVTFYHFIMRLIIGYAVDRIFGKHIDPTAKWFAPKKFEHELYKKLKVRKWKGKMPTFAPEQFDIKKYSFGEIIRSMCIAEVVHEVIAFFALLPIFLAIPIGDFWIFFITSVLSSAFDLVFVILQRYNRPRIMHLLSRKI